MKNPFSPLIQDFILDSQTRTVVFRHHSQRLTRIEYLLLERLLHRQGYLVERQELLQAVWGSQVTVESRTIDSHIVRLRRKLNRLNTKFFVIETVWGLGYRFHWFPHKIRNTEKKRT